MLGSPKSLRSKAVRRPAIVSLLCLTVGLIIGLPASAEEIVLKDGVKIVGHLTRITSDEVEVDTSYGRVQLSRSDIITINFPENSSGKGPEIDSDRLELPKNDETLSGTQYVNRTGKFSLALPPGWIIDKDLLHSPSSLAGLSSSDKMRFTVVVQEEYPGSLESYKDLTILHVRRTLDDFEELSESNVTIDGKTAMLVFYRGVVPESNNLPVEFLSAIIPSGNRFAKVTAWCVEPLFHDMQPAFEKIVSSYHSLSPVKAANSQ